MSPKDIKNGNDPEPFLEEFDDDLDEDWESAFQGDDFVFSTDEETEDFFKPKGQGEEDVDLSTLDDSKPAPETSKPTVEKEKKPTGEKKSGLSLPHKICLASIPLIVISAALYFTGSFSIFSLPQKNKTALEKKFEESTPVVKNSEEKITTGNKKAEAKVDNIFQPLSGKEIRKRYNLPPIFVTATGKEDKLLFVSTRVALILEEAPDQALMEDERIRANDMVYQFFRNRPAEELEDYALNRGKMVNNIQKWVGKNWPDSPLTSIIIESYQVNKSL